MTGGGSAATEGTSGPTTTTGSTDTSTPSTSSSGPAEGFCGDGNLDDDEECDDGPDNADQSLCTSACTKARCGDNFTQPTLGEECDLGELNNIHAACTDTCQKATCGDGKVFFGVEECDDGESNQAGLYDGCTPMTCTRGPHCGDGNLDLPQEECDLGEDDNGGEGQPCTNMCGLAGKMIFATSKLYSGAIGDGGAAAADDKCETVAMEAGIANANAFRAWISDGSNSPATWPNKPQGPFILPGAKAIVAQSWDDLVDGTLSAPIDAIETGAPLDTIKFAWTGTSPQGGALADRCVDWTIGTKAAQGTFGLLTKIDAAWTAFLATECQQTARLVCIEG
ncbi:MAG: hypothetical protein KC457_28230 [Myxococcales bacterium]|nr:hypothetical protein [Myxococcales bacterium]